jgi:hypothetical protein
MLLYLAPACGRPGARHAGLAGGGLAGSAIACRDVTASATCA